MAQDAPGDDRPTLDAIEHALSRGDEVGAIDALLPLLDGRGDPACALAARLLRLRGGGGTDGMAPIVDRLVHLVREQEAQIRALRAMAETGS